MSADVPLARDTVETGKRLLARLTGRAPETTVGTSVSAGSGSLVGVVCGRDVSNLRFDATGWHAARAGGNFQRAYDASSKRIFDAIAPI